MPDDSFEDKVTSAADVINLTIEITAAYVMKNTLPARDLPALITSVHAALAGLGGSAPASAAEDKVEKPTPAQIRKSITPDALISFIDGNPYKMLKRHLTAHGLDASSYRQRYGLPADYPMTAPNYSAMRSEVARTLGLGQYGGRRKA
ncbi:putative transcriptional regulator [Methylobacterium sp. RAS18]|nr:putative transcriptional regulator [Methylobacterium sp. RAS18]